MAIRPMESSGQCEASWRRLKWRCPNCWRLAGGLDQMLAAIAAGADAIYAGWTDSTLERARMALAMMSSRAVVPWPMPMACVCT